ncbi:DUF5007 domain-containing protein [Aureibaculum sp. 2210JD6-5]|uniref:DUF5007 domain-containing protein n=1 Tax=Aureibaculum sp. 2210JD6-5 TaxID=3103957 RepID=UPI002AAD9BAA|nr:DUF5007 domain-containing protein [Aureibaculum sp. 2210JD6-5]MDY7394597.1 DUF5007 domain-containing protein [Aureibaculum sp. 2210JD6-5]
MKNILITLLIAIVFASCTPPEVGYISDNIHALEDTIFVPRGVFKLSAAPAAEGSTYPLEWEITGITDADGNPTDALFQEYEITTWTEPFNPLTDTTLELIQAKIKQSMEPSILMSSVSGEIAFTQSTKFVNGDIFKIHVKAKNVKGERQLDDFVVVKLSPFEPVEFPTEMRSRLQLGKGGGAFDIGYTSVISNGNDDGVPSVLDGTHPYITVLKTSDEPAVGINVKMIIADSYGTPLNPEKVVFYPSGGGFLQNYHENSIETTTDATSTTFSLPAPPFPQYASNYSGSSSYLMYYLTTTDAFTVDKDAFEADNGPKDWSPYIDPDTGEIRNRAYIRWGIKINDSGTWEIKMKIPYTKIKE